MILFARESDEMFDRILEGSFELFEDYLRSIIELGDPAS